MGPELTLKWWSANKAKTLLREPLTAALQRLDVHQKKLSTSKIRYAEDVEAALTTMRGVIAAIDETSKKCLPVVHATTKKNLVELKREALEFQQSLRKELAGFETELGRIRSLRSQLFVDTVNALKKPSVVALDLVQKDCLALGQRANRSPLKLKSFYALTLNTGGTQGAGIWGVCRKFKEDLTKQKTSELEKDKRALRLQLDQLAKVPIG